MTVKVKNNLLLHHIIVLILIVFLFINPLFWIAAYFADFQRPLFNTDYSIIIFLLFLVRNKSNFYLIPIVFMTLFLFCIDLLDSISTAYVFASFKDIFGLLKYIGYANHLSLFILFGLFSLILISIYMVKLLFSRLFILPLVREGWVLYFLIMVFLTVAGGFHWRATDYETIKSDIENNLIDPNSDWMIKSANTVFGSQSYFMYASMHTGFKDAREKSFQKYSNANDLLLSWPAPVASDAIDLEKDKRVLLIVVESFGYPQDMNNFTKLYPSLNKFASLLSSTQLESILTTGVTVTNEIRELCKLAFSAPDPTYFKSFDACLPEKMKKNGIKTVSMHAASRGMYDRDIWYKKLGFDHSFFLENTDNLGKSYSFPGGQDVRFMPKLKELLNNNPDSLFVYWLTLNSHFPYDSRDTQDSTYVCPEEFSDQLCHYAKIHDIFFNSLYDVIKDEKNLKVIITGDHMPPFMKRVDQEYFVHDAVPGIVIEL